MPGPMRVLVCGTRRRIHTLYALAVAVWVAGFVVAVVGAR